VQASDSAARLAAEAEDTELRYNKARLGELCAAGCFAEPFCCWCLCFGLFVFWTVGRALPKVLSGGDAVPLSQHVLWPMDGRVREGA
jgi:hypothetical protein